MEKLSPKGLIISNLANFKFTRPVPVKWLCERVDKKMSDECLTKKVFY